MTADDVAHGNPGTITTTFTQSGCALGGTWTFTFAAAQLDRQLEVTGNAPQGPAVDLDLKQCTGPSGSCATVATCDYLVNGTLVSPTEITGSYMTGTNCSFSESGAFDITLTTRLTPTPAPGPTPTA